MKVDGSGENRSEKNSRVLYSPGKRQNVIVEVGENEMILFFN